MKITRLPAPLRPSRIGRDLCCAVLRKVSITIATTALVFLAACSDTGVSVNTSDQAAPASALADIVSTTRDGPPNIVLVVSDDQRWDLMSGQGHPFVDTPSLDAMATTGTLMQNAFVPVALCSPSRGALLTGRDVHKASTPRIVWNNNSFLQTQRTIGEDLKDAGYDTAYIGKWHLGQGSQPKPGFDHWEGFNWLGDFFNPRITINGVEQQFEGFVDDILAERAKAVIEANESSDNPLFMIVGLKQPHLHFEHPERHENAFANVFIPRPDTFNEDFAESGKLQEIDDWLGIENFPCGLDCFDNSWDTYIRSHYRAIQGLDDAIGTIRDAINESGKGDNTLFIYTSDNGYSLGDHGLTEKHFVYEEPIRVPLLVDAPGNDGAGVANADLVSTIDIAPTIFDYAGLPMRAEFTGKSMRPLIEAVAGDTSGAETTWREQLFFMYEKAQVAVRTQDMKLIRSLTVPGHFELYDLANDPKETRTVYADPTYSAARVDMQRRLKSIIEENDWSHRKTYPVRQMLVSNTVATADADALARAVSALPAYPQPDETETLINDLALQWRDLPVGTDRFGDRFLLKEDPLANDGQSVLAILPLELLTEWDSFIEIKIRRRTKATVYHGGQEIYNNTAEERLPLDIANPPLFPGENFAVIRFDDLGAMDVKIEIESPEDTIRMPLEQGRLLGNAPGRFFAFDSWQPHNNISLNQEAGAMAVVATGADARMQTENVYAEQAVNVRLTYTAAEAVPITAFWRSQHDAFSAEQSVAVELAAAEGNTVNVTLNGISGETPMDVLRLDLDSVDGTLSVHAIEVFALNGALLHQWQFTGNVSQN